MTGTLALQLDPAPAPALVAAAGRESERRYWEFFAVTIRNRNTREAYLRAARDFFRFAEARGVADLREVSPMLVAAWVETGCANHAAPTVKQRLAGLRMLFDWLVAGGALATNAAASVRGPSHSPRRGRTPALTAEQARRLLDEIDATTLVGLRDQALIGAMLYAMARVGAATALRVGDVETRGRRTWLRLAEKGGRVHDMPAHHALEDALHAYMEAAGIKEDRGGWLFRAAAGRTGALTERPLAPRNAHHMIRRRAAAAGIDLLIGCHSLRATGVTAYLAAGGTLEMAQRMAGHANPRTTQLYDRRDDAVTLVEVERIIL